MIRVILFAALMAVPLVAAGGIDGSHQQYPVDAFAQARDNPGSGNVFSRLVNVTPRHHETIESSRAILSISYMAFTDSSSAGIYRYDVFWDNVTIPNCYWQIETTTIIVGFSAVPTRPSYGLFCHLTSAQLTPGFHQLRVTRSTLSGSPSAILHENIAYNLERNDLLVSDMTNEILEALVVFTPILIFAALIVWAEWTEQFLIYLLAVLAGLIAVFTLSDDLSSVRLVIVAGILFLIGRTVISGKIETKGGIEE